MITEFVIGFLLFAAAAIWLIRLGVGDANDPIARYFFYPLTCGYCGYAAEGRYGDRCDKCGVPYADTGLATPATAIRLGPPLWVIAILLIALTTPIMLIAKRTVNEQVLLFEYGVSSMPHLDLSDYRFAPSEGPPQLTPRDPPNYLLVLDSRLVMTPYWGTNRPPDIHRGVIELRISGIDVSPASLRYDFESTNWSILNSVGRSLDSGSGIEAGVEALFQESGADSLWAGSSHEELQAKQIAKEWSVTRSSQLLGQSRQNRYGLEFLGGTGTGGTLHPSPLYQLLAAAVLIGPVLVFVGLLLIPIHRARQRVLNPPRETPDTASSHRR